MDSFKFTFIVYHDFGACRGWDVREREREREEGGEVFRYTGKYPT